MNTLPRAGDGRWRLPRHAHVVVYEADAGDELLTIYDCGAAQKPPSARLIGNLVRVDADAEVERTPTGYVVSMRERSVLERQAADHWVIRSVPAPVGGPDAPGVPDAPGRPDEPGGAGDAGQ